MFVVIATEGNRFAALCMTLGPLSAHRLKCNVGRAADSWREHQMWVKDTQTAGLEAAMVNVLPQRERLFTALLLMLR